LHGTILAARSRKKSFIAADLAGSAAGTGKKLVLYHGKTGNR